MYVYMTPKSQLLKHHTPNHKPQTTNIKAQTQGGRVAVEAREAVQGELAQVTSLDFSEILYWNWSHSTYFVGFWYRMERARHLACCRTAVTAREGEHRSRTLHADTFTYSFIELPPGVHLCRASI